MIDAFSNASEVWVVNLDVNASRQGKETRISEKRSSSNSSCPKYLVNNEAAVIQSSTYVQVGGGKALIIALMGVVQSTSSVDFLGMEIVGDCAMVRSVGGRLDEGLQQQRLGTSFFSIQHTDNRDMLQFNVPLGMGVIAGADGIVESSKFVDFLAFSSSTF
ncbi:16933_t:CDS:2 [Acaulospora colombiana]|uniref:16933_t:CDS:1 n=1 Tax=Acaulospora colombiana TaxID=27376 RepID=A0ACA9PUA7_9GLOM|nr:16933_t:CDS:2 [Acaulospora colombiana]